MKVLVLSRAAALQNELHMNVTNSGYSDPNQLRFEEIRILGLQQELTELTVLQNNVVLSSSHNITYKPTEKVGKWGWRGGGAWGLSGKEREKSGVKWWETGKLGGGGRKWGVRVLKKGGNWDVSVK